MGMLSHFKTVCKHKREVRKIAFAIGLYWQGITHDLSKFSPAEFLVGAKYYQGTRSPNDAEREKKGYSDAWMHHKGRNKHHIEYWTDYHPVSHLIEPVKMPRKYVGEMFCDRVAASKIYQGDRYTDASALAYFEKGRFRRVVHPETSDEIEHLLRYLAENGEKKAFAYVKQWVKEENQHA